MFGTPIIHYWHNNNWVNLMNVNQDFENIQLSLNAFFLNPNHEDEMIWNADPSGQFKVSSLFSAKEKTFHPLWLQAWIKGLIPKINIFY